MRSPVPLIFIIYEMFIVTCEINECFFIKCKDIELILLDMLQAIIKKRGSIVDRAVSVKSTDYHEAPRG